MNNTNSSSAGSSHQGNHPWWLHEAWILSTSAIAVLMSTTCWLTASTIAHHRRTPTSAAGQQQPNRNIARAIVVLTTLVPLMTSLRLASTLSIALVGRLTSRGCGAVMAVSSLVYAAASLPVYLLLWVRQRLLYSHRRSLNTTAVSALSWLALALMCVGAVANWSVFNFTITYRRADTGCVREGRSGAAYYQIELTTFASHLLLFSLFCHPLRLYYRQPAATSATKRKIVALARRALVTLVASSLSDLVAMLVVTKLLPDDAPKDVTGLVYDVGLVVNAVTVAAFIDDFRLITCWRRSNSATTLSLEQRA